jgi:hypothetical protein
LASLEQMGGWRDEDGSYHLSEDGAPGADASDERSNVLPFRAGPGYERSAGADSSEAAMAVGDETTVEDEEEAPAVDEPMNRGLLLKFLSSVRN